VALVTGFAHKYRFDLFFRTELNIIALQIAFSILILFAVIVGISFLYRSAAHSFVEAIASSLKVSVSDSAELLIRDQLTFIKNRSFLVIVSVIVPITVIFGYLIARITLAPTRGALSSQKQFIGNVAHEIRTPLSIIKTNTEVALLDDELAQGLRKTLHSNIEELDRISDIINNLLSLNTLNRPERIELQNVDLGAVTNDVVAKLKPLLTRRKLTLHYNSGDFRIVWGNPVALGQILMNVLKNAIGYTPEGGTITVSIAPDYRSHVVVMVADTGVGIERKDLLHIFEPFYRADRARVREQGGSGLGLAIVSELIKLHRGKISIKSTPKIGTTVTISLPAGKDVAPPQTGAVRKDEVAMDYSEARAL
jgi:signal transduction histidine kinase